MHACMHVIHVCIVSIYVCMTSTHKRNDEGCAAFAKHGEPPNDWFHVGVLSILPADTYTVFME